MAHYALRCLGRTLVLETCTKPLAGTAKHFLSVLSSLCALQIHNGIKKTTRQEVSIFIFDKKSPEFEKLPRKQKEAVYEMLKKVGGVICCLHIEEGGWSHLEGILSGIKI